MTAPTKAGLALHQKLGLVLGPLSAGLVLAFFSPEGVSDAAIRTAAIALLMAIWWATEATPVAVTALLPLVLFPFLGVMPIAQTAPNYAHPIIYLFLGGFLMALAIERSGLHRRVALQTFRLAGLNGSSLIAGFMIAAALLRMWISNTSTALMLLPIAMSVIVVIREQMRHLPEKERRDFETALLLALAYGATLGGISTLVGTPPNAFMVGFLASNYDIEIDFSRWMLVGVPTMLILLPITWFVLCRVAFRVRFRANEEARRHISELGGEIGPWRKAEVRVALVFAVLVAGWLFRGTIASVTGLAELSDAGIAMAAGIALFLIPSGERGEALMTWEDTRRLPWGVLILFGGGLALAQAMSTSGLTGWIGTQLSPLGTLSIALLLIASVAMVIFLTELTSNLATTATFLPVMAAIAVETGQDPLMFVIPVTLAASCAFMLPVATPPNAIVFSSGSVSIPRMMRAGVYLNMMGVLVLSMVAVFLVPRVF